MVQFKNVTVFLLKGILRIKRDVLPSLVQKSFSIIYKNYAYDSTY